MSDATIRCPRCRENACRVWRHKCNRFVCLTDSSECPAYDSHCDACGYPIPQAVHGGFRTHPGEELLLTHPAWQTNERIPPLPPPYDGRGGLTPGVFSNGAFGIFGRR